MFFNTIHTFKIQVTGYLCLLDTDPNFPTSPKSTCKILIDFLSGKAMQWISDIILHALQ